MRVQWTGCSPPASVRYRARAQPNVSVVPAEVREHCCWPRHWLYGRMDHSASARAYLAERSQTQLRLRRRLFALDSIRVGRSDLRRRPQRRHSTAAHGIAGFGLQALSWGGGGSHELVAEMSGLTACTVYE
jgi:hypothetical protein